MKQLLFIVCFLCAFGLQAQKKSVAVILSVEKGLDESISTAFRDAIQEGIHKSGKYEIYAREDDLAKVQKEYNLLEKADDIEQLAEWGTLIKADVTCYVSISKVFENYQVACKMYESGATSRLVFMDSKRTTKGKEEFMDILEYIIKEMFSGRSGKATAILPNGICKDCVKGEISISNEQRATWEEAMKVCECKGDDWRLPDKDELKAIFNHQDEITENGAKKFPKADYWSSSKRNNYEAFSVDFNASGEIKFYSKLEKNAFRCIKTTD